MLLFFDHLERATSNNVCTHRGLLSYSPHYQYNEGLHQSVPRMIPLRHIPALFIATIFTFGGLWPLWNRKAPILEFGLPEHIADSEAAQTVFIISSSRMTVMGLALYAFYYRRLYSAIDILMLCLGWAGVIDGYVCWREEVPDRAVFRALSGAIIAGLGALKLTEGR